MSVLLLPDFRIRTAGELGSRFLGLGLNDFRQAARWVHELPYGRTRERGDFTAVLSERRGTCSTKHALLAALAHEHGEAVVLMLGIYRMSGLNTPGIAAVLALHGFAYLPEAHCYLSYGGRRIDLSGALPAGRPIDEFLSEEPIEPMQIGSYKLQFHQRWMRQWAARHGYDCASVWRAREACIAALSSPQENG